MINKNDVVTVKIEDISSEGQGIGIIRDESTGADACGFVLFIKDTVIGDVVEAKVMKTKKTYGYARLVRIIEPSPDRVTARCPVARQCGGCQLQEMSYEAQLRFKQNKVANNLKRLGGLGEADYVMHPIVGMTAPDEPYHYRNKAQFPVGQDRDGNIKIGFYAGRTHDIIDCMDCCIGDPVNEKILQIVRQWMTDNNIKPYNEEKHSGVVRHILIRTGRATGEICVCLVINANKLQRYDSLVSELAKIDGMTSIMINVNREKTNVILGRHCETLWGRPYIEDCIGDVRYRISPLSFYQVNPVQTKRMYDKVLEYAQLTGNEAVWDLYCGIGTISLFLAKNAKKVYGVEIVPQAIEDAGNNAALNNIDNAQFFVGKAEEVVPEFYKNGGEGDTDSAKSGTDMLRPDVIVVDPPRKGCDTSLLDTMLEMAPPRIVYVSCDSATLARDLKYLRESGRYEVRDVQCYDNFCQGVHVETVVLMSRVSNEPRTDRA